MDKMREEFEGWFKEKFPVSPLDRHPLDDDHYDGVAADWTWSAWQAARAQPVAAIDTSPERVEKYCENRHDCQPAGEAVAWRVWRGDAYELFFNKESAVHRGNCFVPNRRPEPLYTAPSAQVPEGWRNSLMAAFPLFDDDGLDEVKHHCEWHLQQDRKRLHAMLSAAPSAQGQDGWQLVEQLADALRNVEEEMRLLSWQKSIELRRPAGSFGIAVKNDPLALEWQEVDSKLQDLYAKRRAALDAATQPKGGE